MPKRESLKTAPLAVRAWVPWLRAGLVLAFAGVVVLTGLVWFIPVEVLQEWALASAPPDDYKRFEAVGRAEIGCWLARYLLPLVGVVVGLLVRNVPETATFVSGAVAGALHCTRVEADAGRRWPWRTMTLRGLCLGWALIAAVNSVQAVDTFLKGWPYYQLRSGSQVLPNISDANRDVIRFLRETVPPGSRVFVASDQKLYFLSYYLLPSRLYYKVHPDSEYVIPKPYQRLRLAAYRLSEIDAATIEKVDPDYILEYFEHPDFVDRARLTEDVAWTNYYRQSRGDPTAVPGYLVRLRRVDKDRPR